MSVTYAHEPFSSFVEELQALLPEHYEELCVVKEYPLDPDWVTYARLEQAGILPCVTARVDGKLVGYVIYMTQPHLHYRACMTAFEDIYFLKKEYRLGRTGIRLFQYAEKVLKQLGVNRVVMGTKVHSDKSRLFEYLGYKMTDKVFTKLLNQE
jgi:hypothetical protein